MKNRVAKLLSISVLAASIFSFVSKTNKISATETSAITDEVKQQVAELMAPATETYSGSYYNGITAKSGKALRDQLHNLILPHTKVSYDDLYGVYLDSDLRPDGTIWDMYADWDFKPSQHTGNYNSVGDMYNREHSIPKSWWGGGENEMYSDAFHLIPTDGYVNNWRSNYPLAEVATFDKSKKWTFNKYCEGVTGLGSSATSGITGNVFEPADCYKGDLARQYFYFITTYYHNSIYQGNSSQTFSSSTKDTDKLFGLTTASRDLFVKWSHDDPVSQKEVNRCNGVYKHQNNRNPFIDHPEFIDAIWGNGEVTIDPGTEAPVISVYSQIGGGNPTLVSGNTIEIKVGDYLNVLPYVNSTRDDSVTHTIIGNGVIEKSNICYNYHPVIKGLAVGTGSIKFEKTYDDKGTTKTVSKTINIKVNANGTGTGGDDSGGGTSTGDFTNYLYKGKTCTYEDFSYAIDANGGAAPTDKRTYVNNTITFTSSKDFSKVVIKTTINKNNSGKYPSSATTTKGTLTGTFEIGDNQTITIDNFEAGVKEFVVTVGGTGGNLEIESFDVAFKGEVVPTPPDATITHIYYEGDYKNTYQVGETFDATGLRFYAHYSDNTSVEITDDVIIPTTSLQIENETITISYNGFETKISITVNDIEVPPVIDDDDDEDDTGDGTGDEDTGDTDIEPIQPLPGLGDLGTLGMGCMGDIGTASFIVTIFSLLGVLGIIFLKRKKEN